MEAGQAAMRSREHRAVRYDEAGHVWIYNSEKSGLVIQTSMRDEAGDYIFELHEGSQAQALLDQYDDWKPLRPYLHAHLPCRRAGW